MREPYYVLIIRDRFEIWERPPDEPYPDEEYEPVDYGRHKRVSEVAGTYAQAQAIAKLMNDQFNISINN